MEYARNNSLIDANQSQISARSFRDALGRFATGVTIVTTLDAQQRPVGLTANSFNSVSIDPPLVLWSLSKSASSMAAFATQPRYVIHILAADQIELAKRFSNREIANRFAGVPYQVGAGGVPVLDDCIAWFECAGKSQHDEGDHILFVGQVTRCVLSEQTTIRSPLIYHGGKYFTELPLG
jgi:flavin reductase (DIM6/NTAB) family NADH-FMN oxidoreductase RutF